MDAEKESENPTTGSFASTKWRTQERISPNAKKSDVDMKANGEEKGCARDSALAGAGPESTKALIAGNDVLATNRIANATPLRQRKRESNGREVTATDQGLGVWIQPFQWNTNWDHSEGLVTVRIYGEGYEAIAPSSLRMICPEGDETGEPIMFETGPFFVVAKFMRSEAIRIIPEPTPGETCEIQVTWESNSGGEAGDGLFSPIRIVGRKQEAGELTLEIRPDKWNRAWASADENDDTVTAHISGEGFDKIKITPAHPFQMRGPARTPIAPISAELAGFSFIAKFSKSQAITLIPNPPAASYQILVTFYLGDGTYHELSNWIAIRGKNE